MKLAADVAILKLLSPGFGGTSLPDYIKAALENGLGAITLFGSNTPDLETTARVVSKIREYNPNCLVSIDEEAGDVTRIWAQSGSPFPSPYLLGRIDDERLTEEVFFSMGSYLSEAGINLTFGPVLDLVVQAKNPIIGVRSFGEDQNLVAKHGLAAIKGLTKAGVKACPKHFPGHGNTIADSHHGLPRINSSFNQLKTADLIPFFSAIRYSVPAMMVGHLVVDDFDTLPATLSSRWNREYLRDELGFGGVIVTDALDMGALGGLGKIAKSAISAVKAGADLLCLSGIGDQSLILEQIQAEFSLNSDEILLAQIEESASRISGLVGQAHKVTGQVSFSLKQIKAGFEQTGNAKVDKSSVAILSLEADPTVAAGKITWGLENAMIELGCQIKEFDLAATQVIQFRDAWRDPVILGRLEMLRREYPNALFVDFGWPTREFNAPNLLRTFGASRIQAAAAAELLLN